MTREQWAVYFAAREVFSRRPGVRLRTEADIRRRAVKVFATAPNDVERSVSVPVAAVTHPYDPSVPLDRQLIELWDLRDAIPTGAPPWR